VGADASARQRRLSVPRAGGHRPLADYEAKRDFQASPEPTGGAGEDGHAAGAPETRFVIQEHSATRLHWDLRLERAGVLASWAVPNGIPDDPAHNRKAVHTEDHPLEYLDFEGDIPTGSYGAGTMRIWDRGTYSCEKWQARKVVLTFHGERVRGRYSLFQTGSDSRDWMMHRMDAPVDPAREPMPEAPVPMLARAGTLPGAETGWAYEIKWDGVRALAHSTPGSLRLLSRNGRDITSQYPELRRLNRALGSHDAILDGEIVAFDAAGRPSFARLQERMHIVSESVARRRAADVPATYVLFDLVYLDGHSLTRLPYAERRRRLVALALDGEAWRTPAAHEGDGAALLAASARQGLEGLIAKRLDSAYEPGRRAPSWVKVKNSRRQELVVGGWLPGEGRRAQRIGALLVGFYEAAGSLRYAGRVGTGFTDAILADLARRMAPLRRSDSPFGAGRFPRGAQFCEPELVIEVEFTEWTRARMLRHPAYKGLRDDKAPEEVVLEDPRAPSPARGAPTEAAAAATPAPGPVAGGGAALFEDVRMLARGGREVTVEGRRLKLSNYEKVLYPVTGFTKGDLIEFYAQVAPVLLPHLRDRPLTLKRYPDGVQGPFFYEKKCPHHRPQWVQTATVRTRSDASAIDFCLGQDTATLVWAANLADIELHTSLALAADIARPRMLVFDLDPGEPAGLLECCEVGLVLNGLFEGLGLQCAVKTSGSKGMQVYLPLNHPELTYAQTKPFARQVAELLETQMPELVVSRMTKSVRGGRVLVDWSQNDEHKTTVCAYSVRARERPTVSTPLSWAEVREAYASGDAERLVFDTVAVLDRVRQMGDLFAPALTVAQDLPALAGL